MSIYTDVDSALNAIMFNVVKSGDTFQNILFKGVVFNGKILRSLNFSGCSFLDCDMANADMDGCDFSDALFTNVSMYRANMLNTYWHDADLIGNVDVSRAYGIVDAGKDNRGYHFFGVQHSSPERWMIKAGCRWFTVSHAIQHWADKHNNDALARVRVIEAKFRGNR